MMYDHKTYSYNGYENLLSQMAAFLPSYGFTVDVVDADTLHFHGAATEHYHIEIYKNRFREQRSLKYGLCSGWKSGDNDYTDQPGRHTYASSNGTMETGGGSNDWGIQGNAHLFIAQDHLYLTYSVTREKDSTATWVWLAMGKIPKISGTYSDNPRFCCGSYPTDLDADGRIDWSSSCMFGAYSNLGNRQVEAHYIGGPSNGQHSSYNAENAAHEVFQPEYIANGCVFAAGTQGGYRVMFPLELWVNNTNKECIIVGILEGVHLISGQARLPFEEFTVSGKKYVFAPASYRNGAQHYGYAIHVN